MTPSLYSPAEQTAVRCRIDAWARLQIPTARIRELKRQPLVICGKTFPASFLKHADEQSVIAVHAVQDALHRAEWQAHSFNDWAIIAAPTLPGRVDLVQTLQRYPTEGCWAVSPHQIPQQSLHAISGMLSQVLQCHGPNLGVGGGVDSSADAFLLATALLAGSALPGLWLVLTGHEPELIPASEGNPGRDITYHATVLALKSASADCRGPHLTVKLLSQGDQLATLTATSLSAAGGKWKLADTHWLEMDALNSAQEVAA